MAGLIPDLFGGVTVTVSRPVFDGVDQLWDDAPNYADEQVDNVLVAPTSTGDEQESNRPWGTANALTFHFPKTYTASLRGCRITYDGHTYEVEGDPQPYMQSLAPGGWNRPVKATEVLG